MKMSKEILMLGNIEIEKNKFYRQKTPIFWEKVLLLVKKLQILYWLLVQIKQKAAF